MYAQVAEHLKDSIRMLQLLYNLYECPGGTESHFMLHERGTEKKPCQQRGHPRRPRGC